MPIFFDLLLHVKLKWDRCYAADSESRAFEQATVRLFISETFNGLDHPASSCCDEPHDAPAMDYKFGCSVSAGLSFPQFPTVYRFVRRYVRCAVGIWYHSELVASRGLENAADLINYLPSVATFCEFSPSTFHPCLHQLVSVDNPAHVLVL